MTNNNETGETTMTDLLLDDAPPDTVRCEDCGTDCELDTATALSHGEVCQRCAEGWHTCERCNCDVHSDDLCAHDDMLLCQDCHDNLVADCADCGEAGTREDMRHIDQHGHVCDSCSEDWYTCETCDCDVQADYTHSSPSGETMCESCYHDNVSYCEHCEDDYWLHDGPQCDCESESDQATIHGYNYKPDPVFFGNVPNGAFLGLELELECGSGRHSDMAELVRERLGDYGYLKSDGSLRNGFEIVTHPASVAEHGARFPWSTLGELVSSGARSWDAGTCGMHVHVSRRTFTGAHLGRFLWLFYNNVDEWQKIAGRDSQQWAPYDDNTRCRIGKIAKRCHRPSTRYTAVNLTNTDTVEVRIFRGTLRTDTITGYISAVAAAVEYTRHASAVAVSRNGFAGFRLWAETQGETYRPFLDLAGRKVG